MSSYFATISWARGDNSFDDNKYSRGHTWEFDGGTSVPASASPHIVPLPQSVAAAVDPEEAFIAALSSCHMLFFLDFARREGLIVDSYRDEAEGKMARIADQRYAITHVWLRPKVTYSGKQPSRERETELHKRAHEHCFIANSVNTVVETELD